MKIHYNEVNTIFKIEYKVFSNMLSRAIFLTFNAYLSVRGSLENHILVFNQIILPAHGTFSKK